MKKCIASILIFLFLFLFFFSYSVYAQIAPTPQLDLSQQQQASSATLNPKEDAIQTIDSIKSFVTSSDTLLGGFIFYTPDVFGNTITLKDGTVLPGLGAYRNIFYAICIPFIAVAIAYNALKRLSDETPYALKSLVTRLVFVTVMFIVTPTLLSYSIQANNLLVTQITSNQTFSTFITNFLNNEQQQIQNGADPQQFGIPNTQLLSSQGAVQSFWQLLLQIVLFLISLFFFLMGFLFIAFQFIIRFASLLFLSVLFPLAIPFAITEKTENITNTYFKTWFMFLIHQPAFALGYVLATGFLEAILKTNGASLGMLFFYSGFLFFLGGVNSLVTHIFGSSWSALSTNIQSAILTNPVGQSFTEFKKGAMTQNASGIRSLSGKQFGNSMRELRQKLLPTQTKLHTAATTPFKYTASSEAVAQKAHLSDQKTPSSSPTSYQSSSKQPVSQQSTTSFSSNQSQPQLQQMQQTGYSVTNKKTGVTTTYLTPTDAKADGYKMSQLKQTTLDGNYLTVSQSPLNVASSAKVNRLLTQHKQQMKESKSQGILTNQPARKTQQPITRIYSKEEQ